MFWKLQPNSRLLTRLFFSLVLVMALFGALYVRSRWQLDAADLASLGLTSTEQDWLDLLASLAEGIIQLLQGMTSATP